MECILLPSEPDSTSQAEVSQVTLNSELSTGITCQLELRCDPSSWSLRTRDEDGKEKQKGKSKWVHSLLDVEEYNTELNLLN